jgi:AraC-like DNA-binding protein
VKNCRCLTVRIRDEGLVEEDPIDRVAREVLLSLKQQAYLGRNAIHLSPALAPPVQRLLAICVDPPMVSAAHRECQAKGMALQLLSLLGAGVEVGESERADSRIVEVLSRIDADPAAVVTVASMARLASLGRSQFHSLFRRATGTTLIDHVTQIRIGLAVIQLTTGEYSVAQVAHGSGFSSLSRFYEAFKHYRKDSPKSLLRRRL